jgi:hypothetical protein
MKDFDEQVQYVIDAFVAGDIGVERMEAEFLRLLETEGAS